MDKDKLEQLAKLIRYFILTSTTKAGSGHPSSSLSATELLTALFFGKIFRADLKKPGYPNNDRLIFSKGHASPLLYSVYAAAGRLSEKELNSLRRFGSQLEGHPTLEFAYTEAPTGSLGQGLSIGLGMALNAKYLDKLPYKTYVLLGDSEMTEGSQWEALELAAYYKLDNLIAILDVNRLGQRGATIAGHNLEKYAAKAKSFGWHAIVIDDGHDFRQIISAYQKALKNKGKPAMIIAKTIKGKGVSFLENKNGWHGKALSKDELKKALSELGRVGRELKGEVLMPRIGKPKILGTKAKSFVDDYGKNLATRKAYGHALVKVATKNPNIVSLDGEVSNSTYAEDLKNYFPARFFEMFIAEQNMVGTALGLAVRGKIPFVSTFAAFFTRAFDQIRMAQYLGKKANIKFVGSHAGVSIGEDGASQMGLEDLAIFRTLLGSVVLYPADHASTEKLVEQAARHQGLVYIRTTRMATPSIYKQNEAFPIGGSKTLKQSAKDQVTVIGAGVTLFEALKAHEELQKQKINIRVIDLYSVKPLDAPTLKKAARQTRAIITVEDHFAQGGLGEAVKSALAASQTPVYSLAVNKIPKSGKPEQLLKHQGLDSSAIIKQVKNLIT